MRGRPKKYSTDTERREAIKAQIRNWQVRHSKRPNPFRFWNRAWEQICEHLIREYQRLEARRIHNSNREQRMTPEQLKIKKLAQRAKHHLFEGGGVKGQGLVGFLYYQLRRQNFSCDYCERGFSGNEFEIDHKLPISRGGTNAFENLHFVCQECNHDKNSKTDEEYRAQLLTISS